MEQFAWLTGPQMIDGLGLAETTPGPLIMVVQFIGFHGRLEQSGSFKSNLGRAHRLPDRHLLYLSPLFLIHPVGGALYRKIQGE